MEGNGPLHGSARALHKVVLADDPVAGDFTCARLMGLTPKRVYHLKQASRFLGNGGEDLIDLVAELVTQDPIPFDVLPSFRHMCTVRRSE
jgi:uncharacterized protein (DUF362 family)